MGLSQSQHVIPNRDERRKGHMNLQLVRKRVSKDVTDETASLLEIFKLKMAQDALLQEDK